jgi:hypothetical protein
MIARIKKTALPSSLTKAKTTSDKMVADNFILILLSLPLGLGAILVLGLMFVFPVVLVPTIFINPAACFLLIKSSGRSQWFTNVESPLYTSWIILPTCCFLSFSAHKLHQRQYGLIRRTTRWVSLGLTTILRTLSVFCWFGSDWPQLPLWERYMPAWGLIDWGLILEIVYSIRRDDVSFTKCTNNPGYTNNPTR